MKPIGAGNFGGDAPAKNAQVATIHPGVRMVRGNPVAKASKVSVILNAEALGHALVLLGLNLGEPKWETCEARLRRALDAFIHERKGDTRRRLQDLNKALLAVTFEDCEVMYQSWIEQQASKKPKEHIDLSPEEEVEVSLARTLLLYKSNAALERFGLKDNSTSTGRLLKRLMNIYFKADGVPSEAPSYNINKALGNVESFVAAAFDALPTSPRHPGLDTIRKNGLLAEAFKEVREEWLISLQKAAIKLNHSANSDLVPPILREKLGVHRDEVAREYNKSKDKAKPRKVGRPRSKSAG